MTETTSPDAPAAAPSPAPAPAPDTEAAPSPWGTLPGDMQEFVHKKGWAEPKHALASYRELEKLVGRKGVPLPAHDAPEEEWGKVYDALGRPKSWEDYRDTLTAPDDPDLPEGFYSTERRDALLQVAHKAGLTTKQIETLHQALVKGDVETYKSAMSRVNGEMEKSRGRLKSEWGPDHEQRTQRALAPVKMFGGPAAEKIVEQMGWDKNPQFLRIMDSIARQFAEDPGITAQQDGGGAPSAEAKLAQLRGDKAFTDALYGRRGAEEQRAAAAQWKAANAAHAEALQRKGNQQHR